MNNTNNQQTHQTQNTGSQTQYRDIIDHSDSRFQ